MIGRLDGYSMHRGNIVCKRKDLTGLMKSLLQLFMTFAKLGAMTFGGGYAMLPILNREIVEKRKWATEKEIMDYYAVGQCTPGIISVNTATFIGEKQRGCLGGIAATLGFIAPSILIIGLIAAFIQNFAELEIVKDAFAGIRICVCVLIFNAVRNMYRGAVIDRISAAIFTSVLFLAAMTDISPVWFVIISGGIGLLLKKRKGAES